MKTTIVNCRYFIVRLLVGLPVGCCIDSSKYYACALHQYVMRYMGHDEGKFRNNNLKFGNMESRYQNTRTVLNNITSQYIRAICFQIDKLPPCFIPHGSLVSNCSPSSFFLLIQCQNFECLLLVFCFANVISCVHFVRRKLNKSLFLQTLLAVKTYCSCKILLN